MKNQKINKIIKCSDFYVVIGGTKTYFLNDLYFYKNDWQGNPRETMKIGTPIKIAKESSECFFETSIRNIEKLVKELRGH